MGDIANDMIIGLCCSWCGIYFREENGYPVLCFRCHRQQGKEHVRKKDRVPQSRVKEL